MKTKKSAKPPKSIDELLIEAKKFNFSEIIPFNTWLRTALQIYRIAKLKDSENLFPEAFILYKRFIILMELIKGHSQFRQRSSYDALLGKRAEVEKRCELLVDFIEREILEFEEKTGGKRTGGIRAGDRRAGEKEDDSGVEMAGEEIGMAGEKEDDSGVEMAGEEYEMAGDDPGENVQTGVDENGDNPGNTPYEATEKTQEIEATLGANPRYSSISEVSSVSSVSSFTPQNSPISQNSPPKIFAYPQSTPKNPAVDEINFTNSPITISSPQRAPKIRSAEEMKHIDESRDSSRDSDADDDNPNESRDTILPPSQTEGGIPLKTVCVPVQIQAVFTSYVAENTTKDLETCGILGGHLVNNSFVISELVIPDQVSTANTCNTFKEEKLMEYFDAKDMFMLGWIHTHPSQACFLSSVDLHTQNGYQLILPESIAIVVAPKSSPNFGIFRLSDPYGIEVITECRRTGFHRHSEEKLYDVCSKGNKGHVVVKKGMSLEVVDLREGREGVFS